MTCAAPIPYDTLVALWAGELPEAEAERVDAHLFACDPCAGASERLGQLVVGLRALIPPVISHAHRDRLLAGGLQIVHTEVIAGHDAFARFAPGIDLLVHVLRGDLAGADRVDVEMVAPGGQVVLEMVSVPFDPDRGELLIACQRHYEAFGAPTFHVHAVTGDTRREVGRYYVEHAWR